MKFLFHRPCAISTITNRLNYLKFLNMIKSIFTVLFLTASLVLTAQNSLGIAVGSKLTYEVNASTDKKHIVYDLVFTVKAMNSEGVTFDWAANNGKKGTVTMSRTALDNAPTLVCDLKNGTKAQWSNQTALFFPKKAFNELINAGETNVKTNSDATATSFKKVMLRDYSYFHNGVKKNAAVVLGAKEGTGKPKIVLVLNDYNFPLVMAIDWNIRMTLKSIQTL